MKFQKRSGTRIQLKCHRCRTECQPKNGDWHDGESNQIFLCHSCVYKSPGARGKLTLNLTQTPITA